ncbi:MAG: DUF2939 domain-containing protein [Pseudomonadota bacterium]
MKRLALIIALVVLGYAALPYWSAYALGTALRDGDEAVLASNVEWERLRAGLGEDLTQVAAAQSDRSEGLRQVLLSRLAPQLIDAGLEAGLTPETIGATMRRVRQIQERNADNASTAPTPTEGEDEGPARAADVRYAFFTGLNTFRISLAPEGSDDVVDLNFERQGLSWLLVQLDLPDSVLAGLTK